MADLTTDQVAARYNVEPPAVRQWCRRELIQGAYEEETPRGKVWRIPESSLTGFTPPKKTGRPKTKESKAV